MFSLNFTPLCYTLITAGLVSVLLVYIYGIRAYIRAYKAQKSAENIEACKAFPKASVIVYCQSDDDTLDNVLKMITSQDYPNYEVVVVCDCFMAHAEMLREKYSSKYDNVYITFIEPGSHNLSRRKLASTIGIKAAKGEIVVTTAANVEISSERWLSLLLAPFCGDNGKNIDVSLGVSMMNFDEFEGAGKWYRQFDALLTNALWIGYAAAGAPYRGDGYNLAFRRQVFFDHKGYAKSINLHNGDDDLFIDEISNGDNTRVVIDKDSILTTNWGVSANRVWSIHKDRYSFTSRWLPHAPFVRSSIQMAMQWIIPALCVAIAVTGWPNLVALIVAIVILISFYLMQIFHYRRLASCFGAVRLWWAIAPFWLWRPLGDAIFRYMHRSSRKKNFTWQR